MIRLTDVSRHFRRGPDVVKALDRVTLAIPDGRFVALMGPSGSGKSTLLNLLSGIDRADEGDVEAAGQQQRVAIARAIVTDPDLIVADEPTGDLDAKSADAVLALLSELNREFHKAIVLVTHDPRALSWVDEVHHLDKGRLLEGDEAERATESLEQALGTTRVRR